MTLRFEPAPLGLGAAGDLDAAFEARRAWRAPAGLAAALLAQGPAAERRAWLLEGRAVAVTTGQQAGLFTGPLYTIHKALSAAAFAEVLSQSRRRAVVPVFWVAGDDHDFTEINHCAILSDQGRAERIVLRERPADAPMLPAYREMVGEEGGAALSRLEALLPPSEFRGQTVAWLAQAYQPGRSLADACAAALAELLAPYGVVVCRGWDAALKAAARPLLLKALRGAVALDAVLRDEAQRLRAAGLAPVVEVGERAALVLVEGRLGRDRLRVVTDRSFVTRRAGEVYTLGELEALSAAEPERLSANVLLRPVLEAHLLPTVGYVGGSGELGYLAQNGPLFRELDVPRPARLPRVSGFLVEARVDQVLARYALEVADLARPEGEVTARVVRDALPGGAHVALEALRRALEARYAALLPEATAIEPTLEKPVTSARNQALAAVHEIEKKLVAHLKRRNGTALQQIARAREQLFPAGKPQERVLCVATYLSRHGRAALDTVFHAAREHARALLEGPPAQV